MKKRIGLLGGISAASTLEYYKTITRLYYEQSGDYYFPEIIIYSLDFQYFTDMENEHKTNEYIDYIVNAIYSLQKAGAEIIAMTANSPHSVYHEVTERADRPVISIVEAVSAAAKDRGLKKVLLTGIKYTMQSDFYQKGLGEAGIEVIVPNEAHQDEINNMIFKELAINRFLPETKQRFLDIIGAYDADGVILGCTELPLLVNQDDTGIVLLDTLSLHCKQILSHAVTTKGLM